MKCPNCSYIFTKGYVCPDCGTDVYIYKKATSASARLYNKGLACAEERDLTGAIGYLSKSLVFNKRNYRARNLLGIVYYEKGLVADALKQWVISLSLSKEDKTAEKYIDTLQRNARTLEQYNDAVRMYNYAIKYLNQRSEDLAIIQLKKALDINPKFVDAYNLLSLCYIAEKDFAKAEWAARKALSLDKKNPIALKYIQELNPVRKMHRSKEQGEIKKPGTVKKAQRSSMTYSKAEQNRTVIRKTEIIAFFVGLICTTAVLMTLVFPAMITTKNKEISELTNKLTKYETKNAQSLIGDESYDSILSENEKLKAQVEKYKSTVLLQEKVENITRAAAYLQSGNAEEASLMIMDIDPASLSDEDRARYTAVKEGAFPLAAKSFFQKGETAFLSNNFDEALGSLENTIKFSAKEDFVDDALFYIGKIAESKADLTKAKEYYQRIIDEFPQSNRIEEVKTIVSKL